MGVMFKKGGGEYENPPEDLHHAVCVDVIDLGERETPWGLKPKVALKWMIDPQLTDSQGRPFHVRKTYTNSLGTKSTLYKDLGTWRGKRLTDKECALFDSDQLIGANCQIQVVHNITDSGTYANVESVLPAPKGAVKLTVPKDYIREKDKAGFDPAEGFGGAKGDDEGIPF